MAGQQNPTYHQYRAVKRFSIKKINVYSEKGAFALLHLF